MKTKNQLILNSVLLIILIWFLYEAFYELFVLKSGVHYPRVTLNQNDWGNTVVNFTLNIPTVTNFIILFSAFVSIYASIKIYIITISASNKRTKKYWRIQLIGFAICFISMIIAWFDFFNTAFQGVG
ncbi:MAG: hypothetical protein K8R54_09795 [Bacteroidales bacterium]|nr:hypothetical protein [Bacteroidales bacterium]